MRKLSSRFAVTVGLVGSLFGCGSSDEPAKPKANTPPPDPGAMPCVGLKTPYEGDDRCIAPPDPSLGIQLHVGPSNYDDPNEVAPFVLQPGEEKTQCYYLKAPNPETLNFYVQHFRMRPGSHHMIIHMGTSATHADGWDNCSGIYGAGWIPISGTQRGIADEPPGGVIAPEDANLYRPLVPNAQMGFELHFYNVTDKPTLREVWVNIMKKETDANSQILGGVFMIGNLGTGIPVGTKTTLDYAYPWPPPGSPATDDLRVVMLYGHRHAHTTRFTVWKQPGGDAAKRELVYDDFDWVEPTELIYNSLVTNPPSDPTAEVAGGSSGILTFAPGDKIEWACEVDNSLERNQLLKIAQPRTLVEGNQVLTAEMCNLFGNEVSSAIFWSGDAQRTP